MGMDYQYAGSASYSRFDEEFTNVASIFGGIKTKYLKEKESKTSEGSIQWWFGAMSSDNSNKPKYLFPAGINETLVLWFNDPYGNHHTFTAEETKTIWECIKEHPEIKEISYQIWDELECLIECNESWDIC